MLYIINAIGPKIIFTFHCMHVVIMALAECALCFTNFKHQGTYGSCVALYGPTKNKQIVTSVRGIRSDAVKLCDLLAGVNIELPTDNRRRSVCKKCSRKVVNLYSLFNEIKNAIIKSTAGTVSPSLNMPSKTAEKRVQCFSPSGLSPLNKAVKSGVCPMRTCNMKKNVCRRLGMACDLSEDIQAEDTIKHLMNLPINDDLVEKNTPPAVKVYHMSVYS